MIYKGPANRLLREGEWTVRQLVEELYAIFQTNELRSEGSLILDQSDATVPSIISNQPGYSNVPSIVIRRTDPDGTSHEITLGAQSDGSFNISKDGQPYLLASPPVPRSLIGRVVSGGPGYIYTVAAWTSDPQIAGGAPGVAADFNVLATQAQIDPTETIPSGTFVMLIGYPDPEEVDDEGEPVRTWYMIVPTWL